jgi:hypothetical protein
MEFINMLLELKDQQEIHIEKSTSINGFLCKIIDHSKKPPKGLVVNFQNVNESSHEEIILKLTDAIRRINKELKRK